MLRILMPCHKNKLDFLKKIILNIVNVYRFKTTEIGAELLIETMTIVVYEVIHFSTALFLKFQCAQLLPIDSSRDSKGRNGLPIDKNCVNCAIITVQNFIKFYQEFVFSSQAFILNSFWPMELIIVGNLFNKVSH